jgi:peptidoglycan/xylan/chitin deacetylase (PgdA/CDA1 family)
MRLNPKLLLKKVKHFALESTFSKQVTIKLDKPMASFTFDDVPMSAVKNGGAILEKYGFKGTYYISMGINPKKAFRGTSSMSDILQLIAERGHEIGCHTYTHQNLGWSSYAKTIANCEQNINAINDFFPGYSVASFSYPFGSVGFESKRALQTIYSTMRSTVYGINKDGTDFSYLRAINLYSKNFNHNKIQAYLDQAKTSRAWIIFYTHGVTDNFGPVGTSPEDLEWTVEECVKNDFEVVTVNQASRKIQS